MIVEIKAKEEYNKNKELHIGSVSSSEKDYYEALEDMKLTTFKSLEVIG